MIYDEFFAEQKAKHGTKYEILAAVVFKALNRDQHVVHDLRLRGVGKRTPHQIDVTLMRPDKSQLRMIVECRHLFQSSSRPKITLDAVRSFASVIRDLKPDVGMMLTTVGYTKPAVTYAEDEGIALAILRDFRDDDWEGRVQQVHVTGHLSAGQLTISWVARDDEEKERVVPLLAAQGADTRSAFPVVEYFYDENGAPTANMRDVVGDELKRIEQSGEDAGGYELDAVRHVMIGRVLVAVRGFTWEWKNDMVEQSFTIGIGDRIAKLLLRTLDGELDLTIFDKDLAAFDVAEDGSIVPSSVK